MPSSKGPYPPEYRQRIVDLVRSGRKLASVAREFSVSEPTIRKWLKQADVDAGTRSGLTSDEKDELARLRRENRQLREEREILKKAAAWFARETDSTRAKDSSS